MIEIVNTICYTALAIAFMGLCASLVRTLGGKR